MNDELFYGAQVRIIRQSKYKTTKLLGKTGIVRSTYPGSGSIPVEFDDEVNVASSRGYFYFKRNEVELVKDENYMEENNVEVITNYINVARVQFLSDGSPSNYKYVNFDPELAVGDTCIAKYNGGAYGVAKVVEILDDTDVKTDREIVAKVDMSAYNQRVANRTKAAELKAKMEERAKQLQDIALYQLLAKDDSAMMDLLKEYQAINNM